jgi:hypothetical protein
MVIAQIFVIFSGKIDQTHRSSTKETNTHGEGAPVHDQCNNERVAELPH